MSGYDTTTTFTSDHYHLALQAVWANAFTGNGYGCGTHVAILVKVRPDECSRTCVVQFLFPRLYKAPALFHRSPKKLRQQMEEGSHRLASCGDLVSARTVRLSLHGLVATWCLPPCCSFVASGGAAGGDLVSAACACRQTCRQFRWQPSAMVVSNSGSRPH